MTKIIKKSHHWPKVMTLVIALGQFSFAYGFDRESALSISQAAIGKQLDDYQFRSTRGSVVNMADYEGKPLVISLIYTSCYHICPTTTIHLNKVAEIARDALGEDSFNLITIGFDVFRDTPVMMKKFEEKQQVNNEYSHFLSADGATIDALAKQLGFQFEASPHGFDHLIQATLVDKTGKIMQQTYGMQFDTPLLVDPLKRLVFDDPSDAGILTSISHQIRLFCTVYDPASNKYRFDYSLFIGMFIGFMSVLVLGVQLVKEWRKTLRSSKQSPGK